MFPCFPTLPAICPQAPSVFRAVLYFSFIINLVIMNFQNCFVHKTLRCDYNVKVMLLDDLHLQLKQLHGMLAWKSSFTPQSIEQLTEKAGYQIPFNTFVQYLTQGGDNSSISILTAQDLLNLKTKTTTNKPPSKSNKRYIILTLNRNGQKNHYPLSLTEFTIQYSVPQLKDIFTKLRTEVELMRASNLNDTNKSQNSLSIQYKNHQRQSTLKEMNQIQSENQMLKAKLARVMEQADRKKANIQIQSAIQEAKQLKASLETPNVILIQWQDKVMNMEETQNQLKKELNMLHRKICTLLTTDKQINARKKGQEIEKQLNGVKNNSKKAGNQLQKLKKQLEVSKNKVKQLEMKAKKLNSQKEAIKKGSKKGPYSSVGSVRSYNSFGSMNSKKSSNTNFSAKSKPTSNYSYNSRKYR